MPCGTRVAYAHRDWLVLGYGSWFAYVDSEFGAELRQLSRDERPQAVADLRGQGMSTRQIGAALGVDQATVVRTPQVMQDASPEQTVTGADGKEYPARRSPGNRPGMSKCAMLPHGRSSVAPGGVRPSSLRLAFWDEIQ